MLKEKPMVSVAGIRAQVGRSLDPEEFLRYVLAFGTMAKGRKMVVGNDTRLSREMVRHVVFAGLMATGYEVIDLGICPTPTVGVMIREERADGGIAITASHNPPEWNALKFFNNAGEFINRAQNRRLRQKFERGMFRLVEWRSLGKVKVHPHPLERHLARILEQVEVKRIKRREFKVVVDCCNATGAVIVPPLLDALGVRATLINTDVDKPFPHPPEPLPENLAQLGRVVQRARAHLGFALDPDGDRLAIVNEQGKPIGEDRTLVIAVRHYLMSRGKTPVVVNLCTSRAVEDVCKELGAALYSTPIGEANVVEKMHSVKSRIGGEGNGGVIMPAIHGGRDAATGMALILEALAATGLSLSDYNRLVPDYAIVKERITITGHVKGGKKKLEKVAEHFRIQGARLNLRDGVKAIFGDRWVQVRPSGTEPIIRIFAEAPQAKQARQLIKEVRNFFS